MPHLKWLSKLCTLQEDTRGMSGMIPTGTMVVDALYFNPVHCVPLRHTPSSNMTVVEVKYVLQSGLQLQSQSACQTHYLTHGLALRQHGKRPLMYCLWITNHGGGKQAQQVGNQGRDKSNEKTKESKSDSELGSSKKLESEQRVTLLLN